MPTTVTLHDYSGGEIGDAEKTDTSFYKVRIDDGYYVHYTIDEVRKKIIENSPSTVAQTLVKELREDTAKQYASKIDKAYGLLYTRAGHVAGSTAPINITKDNVKKLFGYMAMKFQRGDNEGHNSWLDGKMVAVVPPEFEYVLTQIEDLKYTESGQKKLAKGFIGRLCGWDIMVSNNVASSEVESNTVFHPLFGVKGRTLCGGGAKNIDIQTYIPDRTFDTCYKGWGYMGVGAPRADLLGTANVILDTTL